MKKIILHTFVLLLSTLKILWAQDITQKIPDGIYRGSFISEGGVHCSAYIDRIEVKGSKVVFRGAHVMAEKINHSFNLKSNKFENKYIIINNTSAKFLMSYFPDKNTIYLNFIAGCRGEAEFKPEVLVDYKSNELDTNFDKILDLSKKICNEIDITQTNPKYEKCILTILRNFKNLE